MKVLFLTGISEEEARLEREWHEKERLLSLENGKRAPSFVRDTSACAEHGARLQKTEVIHRYLRLRSRKATAKELQSVHYL